MRATSVVDRSTSEGARALSSTWLSDRVDLVRLFVSQLPFCLLFSVPLTLRGNVTRISEIHCFLSVRRGRSGPARGVQSGAGLGR